jgi:hypothetical protein
MSKFDALYRTYEANIRIGGDIVSEAVPPQGQPPAQPPAAPAAGPQSVQPQTPAPTEVKEPTADVTSEGKKFLVELALKALSVDPDNITATEKEIFNTEVTTENADQILSRIQGIVDLYG